LGGVLATGHTDGIVQLRSLATGHTRSLFGHRESVRRIAFSADGALIASASADHTVRVWSVASGATLLVHRHAAEAEYVTFSPDGHLASGSFDKTVWLGTVDPGRLVPTEPGSFRRWLVDATTRRWAQTTG